MGAAVRVITWQCAKRANRIGIIPLVPYRAFLGRDSARKFQHIGQLGQLELVNLGDLLNAIPGVDGLQYFSEGGQSSPKDPEPPVLARQDFYLAALGPIEPGCTLEPVRCLRLGWFARLAGGWRRLREFLFPSSEGCEYGLAKGHSVVGGKSFDAASFVVGELYLKQVFYRSGHIGEI